MRRFARFFLPRRIGAQVAVLVVISLFLAHAATFAVLRGLGPADVPRAPAPARLALVGRMLNATADPTQRAVLLAAAGSAIPGLKLDRGGTAPGSAPGSNAWLARLMRRDPWSREGVFAANDPGAGSGQRWLGVRLADGSTLLAPVARDLKGAPPLGAPILATVVFLGTVLAILSVWAARGLTAPLARFARAVEHFSVEGAAPEPLAEEGPIEVQRAARAFNGLWSRVCQLVSDRTRMLAAISHDLRTPMARMRLRAEDIADPDLRRQLLVDLGLMERLVGSSLAYLRDQDARPPERALIDLPALLKTLCDDFADMGHDVSYAGPDHAHARCDPDGMTRAVGNLVDNAVKFGTAARVGLVVEADGAALISVEDDGPGVRDAIKDKVTLPFFRGDPARNLNDSAEGFGLGLTVARGVAEAHGGMLRLADGPRGGLLATLRFPASAAQGAGACRDAGKAVTLLP